MKNALEYSSILRMALLVRDTFSPCTHHQTTQKQARCPHMPAQPTNDGASLPHSICRLRKNSVHRIFLDFCYIRSSFSHPAYRQIGDDFH